MNRTQAEIQPYTGQFRYSSLNVFIGFLILTAITSGFAYLAVLAYAEDAWLGVVICSWCGFWFALFALLTWKQFRARSLPTNWLMRLQTNGILLKFRSYRNHHLNDQDAVVAKISFSEIEWAREHKLRRDLPGTQQGETESRYTRYVELKLRDAEAAQSLKEQLFQERQRWPEWQRRWWGGRSRGLNRHYPVTVVDASVVRIEWQVRPALRDFLSAISLFVSVIDPSKTKVNYRQIDELPQKQQEDLVLELIESGNNLGAIRVIRKLYGYKTTQAKQFLDELSRRPVPGDK
jgi:hypothetical protein